MSGGPGWDVPVGTFIDIKSGLWSLHILPLQVHNSLSAVWISRNLDFRIINPLLDLGPQAVSGQHFVTIPRCQLSVCSSGTVTQKVQCEICDAFVACLIQNHTDDKALVQACMPLDQIKNLDFNVDAGFSLSRLPTLTLGKCVRSLCVTGNWPAL